MAHDDENRRRIGLVIAGLGTIATALVLVPVRHSIDNANLALVLVVVVVLAAIVGDRRAAVLGALTATMAFDFFLTRPYISMRIDSADDIETALLLLAVGLLVAEVAVRSRRHVHERERVAASIARVQRVAGLVAQGAPLDHIVRVTITELTQLLHLHDCTIEFPPFTWPLPRLERAGSIEATEYQWADDGFALPEHGLQLLVMDAGDEVARFVLIGDPAARIPVDDRIVAVALADQVGRAIALASAQEIRKLVEQGLSPR